jgi:autotransporter-associated beta strand protein
MSTLPFGQARMLSRHRRRAALMLGVSAVALVLLTPARAETITYADDEDRTGAIVLAEDGILSVAPAVGAIQSGDISGDYAITIEGGGRLRLSGDNSHTGGTIIDGSDVEIASETGFGTGAVTLGTYSHLYLSYGRAMAFSNDMVLEGENSIYAMNDTTWTGTISGASGQLNVWTGHLILSGANTYGEGTLIGNAANAVRVTALSDQALGTGQVVFQDDSTLTLGSGVTLANSVLLRGLPNGRNVINADGTATFAGELTGFGGQGHVIYNGGTIIRTGQDDFSGSVRVTGNATLVASGADVLSDQAQVALDSNGTLRLLANQTVDGIHNYGGDTSGTIDLTNRRLITVQEDDTTFGGTITGTSTSVLELNGPGRLTLSGDNAAWGGSLVVRDGVLEVNSDFSDAFVVINGAHLAGTGHLGTVNLNNAATMLGVQGQTLTMDRLVISSGSVLSATFGVAGAPALFHVTGDVELDGYIDIADAGGFGPGVYRLVTYGGTLFNQDANIRDLPDGIEPEDVQLQLLEGQINIVSSAGADVVFWDGGNAANWNNGSIEGGDGLWDDRDVFTTADGAINGPVNPDPGFVIFGGTAGTVEIAADYVTVDGMQFTTDGYVLTGGDIRLDDVERTFRVGDGSAAGAGYTATIESAITGDGGLIKTDAGRLVLNAANTYGGGTEVRGGVLEVNGDILDVFVGANGFLTGTGTVRNADVEGGIGASGFGELSVTGDLSLGSDAVFRLEVDAEGNRGVVSVDGMAFLDGTVDVLASGGDYADATRYTFLRAENGIDGTFDEVVDNLAFLDSALDYDANEVSLLLSRNATGFGTIGETPNQRATGTAVEGLGSGNQIFDRVLTYDVADAQYAFDQLSGEIHATAQGALLAASQDVAGVVSDRIGESLAADNPDGVDVWTSAQARAGMLHGDGNAAPAGFSAGNVFFGADARFGKDWVFGAMGGYGRGQVWLPERNSEAATDSLYAGIYGGGAMGDTTMRFGGSIGANETRTTRDVVIPGFSDHLTSASAGATVQAFGEIGQRFAFDSGLVIEPFVNLTHTSILRGAMAENGGAAALGGSAAHVALTTATVGLRGEAEFTLGGVNATASTMVGWRQALGGVNPTSTHSFAGGNAFTVAGTPAVESAAVVQAGLDFGLSEGINLSFDYDGLIGAGSSSHAVTAGLSARF